MKLKKIRVQEFKSIMDSNDVDITDITCLVGKNEAGKTAFLEALYKLNPIVPEHARFDVVEEYPRAHIGDYMADVELKKRDAAQVIQAWFSLEEKRARLDRKGVRSRMPSRHGTSLEIVKRLQQQVVGNG